MKTFRIEYIFWLLPCELVFGCHAISPDDDSFDSQVLHGHIRHSREEKRGDSTHTMKSVGAYHWISIKPKRMARLPNWEKEVHFCPYRPSKGKWILTCKTNLDKIVDQLAGEHIGKAILLNNQNLNHILGQSNQVLKCPQQEYIATCQYYWHNAISAMKQIFFERLENDSLIASADAFCRK